MDSDEIQSKVEMALAMWGAGERQLFIDTITPLVPDILQYRGRGEILTYFEPALFIHEFCVDLIATGFPIDRIFERNYGCNAWTDWPEVYTHPTPHIQSLIQDIIQHGFDDDSTWSPTWSDPEDENYQVHMEYYPLSIQRRLEDEIEAYYDSTDEDWARRKANCESTQLRAHPQP